MSNTLTPLASVHYGLATWNVRVQEQGRRSRRDSTSVRASGQLARCAAMSAAMAWGRSPLMA